MCSLLVIRQKLQGTLLCRGTAVVNLWSIQCIVHNIFIGLNLLNYQF